MWFALAMKNPLVLFVFWISVFESYGIAHTSEPIAEPISREVGRNSSVTTSAPQSIISKTKLDPGIENGAHRFEFSEEELRLVEKAYLWGWPLVYMSNIRKSLKLVSKPGISGGAPVAPINQLAMLTRPVSSDFSTVPCPNIDVLYGFALLDLRDEPVVLQIPSFQDRYWMIQLGDHRTDSFADVGSNVGTQPGFYIIAGPTWEGEVPEGIQGVFRSSTNLSFILPRILVGDCAMNDIEQKALTELGVYPLSRFHGRVKRQDWSKNKWYPTLRTNGRHESKSVTPANFYEELRIVIDEVPPLPGEEEFYVALRAFYSRIESTPLLKQKLSRIGIHFEKKCIEPLFDFRNIGEKLPGGWSSVNNAAAFGLDYKSRAAVAKSNIFTNRPHEAKYYYLEQDIHGELLDGSAAYSITLPPDSLAKEDGFWSLTLYDSDHRLHANKWDRFAIGSASQKGREWKRNADGSLTIVIQPTAPEVEWESNWIPSPTGTFLLYLRIYSPRHDVLANSWTPPPLKPVFGNRNQAAHP